MHADDCALSLQRFRARFPGALSQTYLNVADTGLISAEVRAEADGILGARALGAEKDVASAWIALARERFAALVHVDARDVAIVKNVSDGINTIACAIDWKQGDNVVICGELEHPSNLYPWYNLARRHGVTVRDVSPDGHHIDPHRICASIDERTRAVSVSAVTYAPGFRTDLESIGAACRSMGSLFVVDAAQAVGVLDVDAGGLMIDALAVGTPKALLGLYGVGFLFVRREVADRMRPAYLSGFGVSGGALGIDGTTLNPGARRFEVGNFNDVGCAAAAVSIGQLLSVGQASIERHAIMLARHLSDGLKAAGLPVFETDDDRRRSHIVSVGRRLEAAIDASTDARLNSLYEHFRRNDVRTSIRRGVLRLSIHAYNDMTDVEKAVDLARSWAAINRWSD